MRPGINGQFPTFDPTPTIEWVVPKLTAGLPGSDTSHAVASRYPAQRPLASPDAPPPGSRWAAPGGRSRPRCGTIAFACPRHGLCSTPHGISDSCTNDHEYQAEARGECSTPHGISDSCTVLEEGMEWAAITCSTPHGISDSCTACLITPYLSVRLPQRLQVPPFL
jgi:hypothetical protein